jgi:hypothetical protein
MRWVAAWSPRPDLDAPCPRLTERARANEALTPRMRSLGLAQWLNSPEPPFWTTTQGHALRAADQEFRRTEIRARAAGTQPKSVFQLVGAGQVGRGSPLRHAGAAPAGCYRLPDLAV